MLSAIATSLLSLSLPFILSSFFVELRPHPIVITEFKFCTIEKKVKMVF